MATPNILMVVADQLNADLLGCAGHNQVLTPHLDQFARQAMRFTQAYCQNPICTPSRVSLLSGQYCLNHGYYGLSGPAKPGLPNIFRHVRSNGYRTAAFGKLHLPNSPRNWIADDLDEFGDAYETSDGEVARSDYLTSLENLGLRDREDSWHNNSSLYGPTSIPLDARPSLLPYEHTMERWCVDQAAAFIRRDRRRPFCIQISFQRPHHPLLPQERFWNLYPADLSLPATFAVDPAGRPPHFQAAWHALRKYPWEFASKGESFEEGARRAWRGTLACISQIDDVFGRLVQMLASEGLDENTIVIFCGDHGGYHGIHGIQEKAPGICSEAVCRVPLLVRAPGVTREGRVCRALAENVDLVPTLLALCGLPAMESVDGHSLAGLLAGQSQGPRIAAVTENPWSKSLRWGRWRFVHYQRAMFGGDDEGDLFDLEEDPAERVNLYRTDALSPIVNESRRLLLEWMISHRRITTSHPALSLSGSPLHGKSRYPIMGDGSAPNYAQPSHRTDNDLRYL